MNGRKSVVALSVLCALALSAFAASSASANQAFECTSAAGTFDKFGEHCLAPVGEQKANSRHVAVPAGSNLINGSNAKTATETTAAAVSTLAGSLSGVATELSCTGLSGKGTMENNEAEGYVSGGGTITYSGCSVVKPEKKECIVKNGSVTTEKLAGTTKAQAANKLKFTPAEGETFAKITIEKCTVASLNNTFPVTGSLIADVSGATSTSTEAGITTQNTLKFGGNKAGLGGALTINRVVKEKVEEKEVEVTKGGLVLT
jgi:hypothetical protein